MTDVSQFLPDSALFFNFVFDWWFTEPLHPDEDAPEVTKVKELKHACTKCGLRFQFDWEVPQHYLETHLAAAKPRVKTPEPVKRTPSPPPPQPPPPPVKEATPEVYVEPYPPLEDWCWQDFLPTWSESFLPSGDWLEYDTEDIEDDDPDPEPAPEPEPAPAPVAPVKEVQEPTPPPPPRPPRPPVAAPVLKQSKFECRTCSLTICNSCFTRTRAVNEISRTFPYIC